MSKELWEILVPASNNKDKAFTYEHHKAWDEFVKNLTGGVTIMKTAKGQWVSPEGELYIDRVIPCRIVCNEEQISEIVDFTIEHYDQEAVLAYRISTNVILRHKSDYGDNVETNNIDHYPDLCKCIDSTYTRGICNVCGLFED